MASTRTQVYLTNEQRRWLDARAEQENTTLAQVIRDAVDAYAIGPDARLERALNDTFGRVPDLELPDRSEWQARA